MPKILFIAIALIGLGLLACSDDDPVTPGAFQVTLNVVDEMGDPVEGVLVNVTSDHPFLPDKSDKKAAVVIPFQTPVSAEATMVIEDVAGMAVRPLFLDNWVAAGQHQVQWNGLDKEGNHVHAGWYTAHLIIRQLGTGTVLFEDSTDMLMSLPDVQQAPVGTTDSAGRLVLTDKRLFPHLYDIPPVEGFDENAQPTGTYELDGNMIFIMADTARGGGMHFERMVTGPMNLDFVWKPIVRMNSEAPEEPTIEWKAPPVDDPDYRLGPAYPNPFN